MEKYQVLNQDTLIDHGKNDAIEKINKNNKHKWKWILISAITTLVCVNLISIMLVWNEWKRIEDIKIIFQNNAQYIKNENIQLAQKNLKLQKERNKHIKINDQIKNQILKLSKKNTLTKNSDNTDKIIAIQNDSEIYEKIIQNNQEHKINSKNSNTLTISQKPLAIVEKIIEIEKITQNNNLQNNNLQNNNLHEFALKEQILNNEQNIKTNLKKNPINPQNNNQNNNKPIITATYSKDNNINSQINKSKIVKVEIKFGQTPASIIYDNGKYLDLKRIMLALEPFFEARNFHAGDKIYFKIKNNKIETIFIPQARKGFIRVKLGHKDEINASIVEKIPTKYKLAENKLIR